MCTVLFLSYGLSAGRILPKRALCAISGGASNANGRQGA
jgi:hypothetical protein